MARLPVLLALLVALALSAAAPSHAAWRAPCTPGSSRGPACTWWAARVTFIADGDTVRARVGGRERTIRFTGINAMELTRYSKYPGRRRGACHGVEATALVERLVKRSDRRVRLAAQRASSRSGNRLRRSLWVRDGGRWRDVARAQLQAGLALWLPNAGESAHDRAYARLAARAIAARRALYDPAACGAGPDQDLPVSVVVNWDADGDDNANVDGEWAEIRNGGDRPLRLAGWRFRDSALRSYAFAAGAAVPAHGSLRLRVGCGADSAGELHWCERASVFENAGDGGYLFDPDGDVRAAFEYPCALACTDPLRGRVRLQVRPRTPEAIALVNAGDAEADLSDHVVKLRNRGRAGQFVFGIVLAPGTRIAPGATLTLRPPQANALADGGGVVELRTLADAPTACAAWGSGRC